MSAQQNESGLSIAMWGTPSSGKTTFLAALSLALSRAGIGWNLVGVDENSERELIKLTTSLAGGRAFPQATQAINHYGWVLNGSVTRTLRRKFRTEEYSEPVKIDLNLVDASGEIAGTDHIGLSVRDELIEDLVNSRGIVFMFDPVREFEKGDVFDYTFGMLVELSRRVADMQHSVGGKLPHYVAVCVAKFDELKVFETAAKMDLLMRHPGDRYEFPRVPDEDARSLFAKLCDVSRSGNAELVVNLLDQYFIPGRIQYFVTSAIGFYLNPRFGVYDPRDTQNLLPDSNQPDKARIRGTVHPINVLEPVMWLSKMIMGDPGA